MKCSKPLLIFLLVALGQASAADIALPEMGSSAAEILKRLTGSDVFAEQVTLPAGGSRVEPGTVPAQDVTLAWATFTDAADEAGISRRYGGIHFVDGDLDSRLMGRRVAELDWPVIQYYFGERRRHGGHH